MPSEAYPRVALLLQLLVALVTVAGLVVAILPQRVEIISVTMAPDVLARREFITRRIKQLEDSVATLNERRAALADSLNCLRAATATTTRAEHRDFWLITVLKTLPVVLLLVLATIVTVFAFAADLVLLLFGLQFPLLQALWSFTWDTVTVGWYWDRATPLGAILGMILVLAGNGQSISTTASAVRSSRRDT